MFMICCTDYVADRAVPSRFIPIQPVSITKERREQSEIDIRAIFAKFGADPSEAIANIPATYKPSDANVLC